VPCYGRVALPICLQTPRRAARAFPVPSTVEGEPLCSVSHLRPVEGCPVYTEYFKEGDDRPSQLCSVHHGSLNQVVVRTADKLLSRSRSRQLQASSAASGSTVTSLHTRFNQIADEHGGVFFGTANEAVFSPTIGGERTLVMMTMSLPALLVPHPHRGRSAAPSAERSRVAEAGLLTSVVIDSSRALFGPWIAHQLHLSEPLVVVVRPSALPDRVVDHRRGAVRGRFFTLFLHGECLRNLDGLCKRFTARRISCRGAGAVIGHGKRTILTSL